MNAPPSPRTAHGFLSASAVALLLSLSFPSCSSLTPNDEPLPSFEELQAIFGEQPVGRGVVREGDNPRRGDDYEVSAQHITNVLVGPAATLTSFTIRLEGEAEGSEVRFTVRDLLYDQITENTVYERVSFAYEGAQTSSIGGGRMMITSRQDGRAEGFFAGELLNRGPLGLRFRVQGSFNAVLDTTAQ